MPTDCRPRPSRRKTPSPLPNRLRLGISKRTLHVNSELADWLEQHGGEAISKEDYYFSVQHSIEFQCVFLPYAMGSDLKIVPIFVRFLC
jgi:hypothetical protein